MTQKLRLQVRSAKEVEAVLRAIPADVIDYKPKMVFRYGTRFSFSQELTAPPNAVNSLLAGICMKQTEFPPS